MCSFADNSRFIYTEDLQGGSAIDRISCLVNISICITLTLIQNGCTWVVLLSALILPKQSIRMRAHLTAGALYMPIKLAGRKLHVNALVC
jgi:hypothetical protein